MRMIVALLAAVQIGCSTGGHQPQPSPPSPAPTEAALEWNELSHARGKYTVLMPGTPTEVEREVPTDVGRLKMTMNVLDLKSRAKGFGVAFADYPAGPDYADEKLAYEVLNGVVEGIGRSVKEELLKKSRIKFGNHHRLECWFDVAGGNTKHLCRVYLVSNRLYQLLSGWSASRGDTSADAEKFMDSFKVVD